MKLLTLARDLRRRKSRERNGLFVAEGIRSVEDLLRSDVAIEGALVAPQLNETARGEALIRSLSGRGVSVQQVSSHELASAADTESPQGVLAVGIVPERTLGQVPGESHFVILVLDAIQDPGNVGALLRTAAGLGATATIALPGTVDLWNAKVVRSGMGAHFHHLCLATTWTELDEFRRRHSAGVWGADVSGEPIEQVAPPDRLLLVVGNEGSGLMPATIERLERRVALRVTSAVESLNVAVAAGILLHELSK